MKRPIGELKTQGIFARALSNAAIGTANMAGKRRAPEASTKDQRDLGRTSRMHAADASAAQVGEAPALQGVEGFDELQAARAMDSPLGSKAEPLSGSKGEEWSGGRPAMWSGSRYEHFSRGEADRWPGAEPQHGSGGEGVGRYRDPWGFDTPPWEVPPDNVFNANWAGDREDDGFAPSSARRGHQLADVDSLEMSPPTRRADCEDLHWLEADAYPANHAGRKRRSTSWGRTLEEETLLPPARKDSLPWPAKLAKRTILEDEARDPWAQGAPTCGDSLAFPLPVPGRACFGFDIDLDAPPVISGGPRRSHQAFLPAPPSGLDSMPPCTSSITFTLPGAPQTASRSLVPLAMQPYWPVDRGALFLEPWRAAPAQAGSPLGPILVEDEVGCDLVDSWSMRHAMHDDKPPPRTPPSLAAERWWQSDSQSHSEERWPPKGNGKASSFGLKGEFASPCNNYFEE
eukprot:jgi/Mesvir1/10559/Mv21783-RA.1